MEVVVYEKRHEQAWDRFVEQESINGTFQQTRNFLGYHPQGRFEDHSLLFMKGTSIAAAIPANLCAKGPEKILFSHQGGTFGGIVLGRHFKRISDVEEIFRLPMQRK